MTDDQAQAARRRSAAQRATYQGRPGRADWGQTGAVENIGPEATVGRLDELPPAMPKPELWTRPPVVDWREETRRRYGDKR